jgi:hypothetical protein
MRTMMIVAVLAFVSASFATIAAPEQTLTPGQMTQAKVWIQNRGVGEAVPVDLREMNLAAPLRVHVVNGDPAHGAGTNPVQVRVLRPSWEYQMLTVAASQDLAVALNGLGAAGWETTGIVQPNADGMRLLLKRPR